MLQRLLAQGQGDRVSLNQGKVLLKALVENLTQPC